VTYTEWFWWVVATCAGVGIGGGIGVVFYTFVRTLSVKDRPIGK